MGKVVDVTLRLIDRISAPLGGIERSLRNNANQWVRAGRQIERTGKNIADTGMNFSKKLTLPILGAGAGAVKVAADFEKGMSTVQSISGATGKDLDMLTKKAIEMGGKTKFSATEATDAFKYMAMAGWKTKQMTEGIEGVMYLAGATGEDLAQTSDIVTDSLTAFGMQANETNRFVNVLASAANNSNTSVAMLGESFKYVGPLAGSLKFNIEDTSTALGLMANAGIKSSQAGTAMRSWITRIAKPTKESGTAMEMLGLSLTDSEGKMKSLDTIMRETKGAFAGLTDEQKAQYAAAIAGKTGMSGLLAVVNSSDSDFNKLSKSINNSTGAAKKMYHVANNNLHGQLTILKSTVESVAISFGERLAPHIKKATEFIQKMADKFNSLSPAQQDMIIKIGLVVAAVGPALLVFGKMVGAIGKVVGVVGKVGRGIRMFGSALGLVTSPAGLVIGILAALVVGGILLYKNWDRIKKAAGKLWGFVKGIFNKIGLSGKNLTKRLKPIGERFVKIGEAASALWTAISPVLSAIGGLVIQVFTVVLGGAIGGAVSLLGGFLDSAISIIDGLTKVFTGIIDFITGVFTGDWEKAWTGIKDVFGGIFESFGALVKMPLNAVISVINGAIEGINSISVNIPEWVPLLGGKHIGFDLPTLPALASGTDNWKGGLVQISEKGGEIVDLPRGSRVYPHDESVRKAYSDGQRSGGGTRINIAKIADTIVVRNDGDIHKIAEAIGKELEKRSRNMGGGEVGYIH